MTKGDVLVASVSAAGDAMRGRFGRLSIVVSDASSAAAVACSSCRRFFADLSSLLFFVFAAFSVFAMFSVDIVYVCCVVERQLGYLLLAVARENKKQISCYTSNRRLHMPKQAEVRAHHPRVKASLPPETAKGALVYTSISTLPSNYPISQSCSD